MSENTHEIDVDYVARLARLDLSDTERAQMHEELEKMLSFFDTLSSVDTEGVEPMAHPFHAYNVWQEDEPGKTFTPEEALMNAPQQRENQVVVPKVVE